MINLTQARKLYREAEKDWEYHDSSPAFTRFLNWIADNFEDLLILAERGE